MTDIHADIFAKALSLGRALLTGTSVSAERLQKRIEICRACPNVTTANDHMACGICGCQLSGENKLVNLARYETTKEYGCKHADGDQWIKYGADPPKE